MAIFPYEGYRSPHVNTIADLILRPASATARGMREVGDAQARATEIGGQAWAGAAQAIGQAAARFAGEQAEARSPRTQLAEVQLSEAQRGQQYRTALNATLKNTPQLNEDG